MRGFSTFPGVPASVLPEPYAGLKRLKLLGKDGEK